MIGAGEIVEIAGEIGDAEVVCGDAVGLINRMCVGKLMMLVLLLGKSGAFHCVDGGGAVIWSVHDE